MQDSQNADFNFEEWASLAKADTQAFEVKRREEIERLIARASPATQARLRGLQWKIDMERRRAGTPLASCMRIFNQMWESVYGPGGLLDALHGADDAARSGAQDLSAQVLEFHARGHGRQAQKLSRPSTHS